MAFADDDDVAILAKSKESYKTFLKKIQDWAENKINQDIW